jgi:transposase
MKRYTKRRKKQTPLYVGVDLHQRSWHVTVIAEDEELFSGGIPPKWGALERILDRYAGYRVQVVYEAGYFGFWLYDEVKAYGADCTVTPPTLLPMEYGNRVKTDRRDSRKLAYLLAKGMLKRVWVPSPEERYHRQVVRRRRQLVRDRVRTQNRIKAELRFYGIDLPAPVGKWTQIYLGNLKRFRFKDRWMQESFDRLLETYAFLSAQVDEQTRILKELSETDRYREKVKILTTVPGIGVIAAMEILLELGDIGRFKKADRLAAYVGLTPSQYSSGDKIRMGRISGAGNRSLRCTFVEIAWRLIIKDPAMREKYDNIKARAGAKRAIVAIARMTLLRTRRMLLDGQPYALGLVA